MKEDKSLKSLYTTLFSQKFSPNGETLAACSNFGEIALYNLPSILSIEHLDADKTHYCKFQAHDSCLYSLENSSDFLICGAVNEIIAWRWCDLQKSVSKKAWILNIPGWKIIQTSSYRFLKMAMSKSGISGLTETRWQSDLSNMSFVRGLNLVEM